MARQRLDARHVITGKDAELYLEDGRFLLHIATWSARMNVVNADNQPAASALIQGVPTGVSFTLALTETVVRACDPLLFKEVMRSILITTELRADHFAIPRDAEDRVNGQVNWEWPSLNFIGMVGGREMLVDGRRSTNAWTTLRQCIPDGDIPLMDVAPGQILTRPWNFRVNDFPDFHSYLERAA